MSEWQPIETAPRDGTWFMICRADEGLETCEVGRYAPRLWDTYVPTDDGLYRKVPVPITDWEGFNNFHRATHWAQITAPPLEVTT